MAHNWSSTLYVVLNCKRYAWRGCSSVKLSNFCHTTKKIRYLIWLLVLEEFERKVDDFAYAGIINGSKNLRQMYAIGSLLTTTKRRLQWCKLINIVKNSRQMCATCICHYSWDGCSLWISQKLFCWIDQAPCEGSFCFEVEGAATTIRFSLVLL